MDQNTQKDGYSSMSGILTPGTFRMGTVGPRSSVYGAFDEFDREARQRKYLIAECEDTIANLKKELEEVSGENKTLEAECEKLEMESKACEAKYEKMLKEKQMIEEEYRAISAEMDNVMKGIAKKRAQMKEMELVHEERMDLIKRTQDEFVLEYRRNPEIAQIMDKQEENKKLEAEIEKNSEELEKLEQECRELNNKFAGKWESFVKKCVEIAETREKAKEQLQTLDRLQAEYDQKCGNQTRKKCMKLGLGVTPSDGFTSSQDKISSSSSLFNFTSGICPKTRVGGVAPVRIQRSHSFREMEKILSSGSRFGIRKSFGEVSPSSSRSPLRVGPSLVAELRSRMKETVMVNPVPRRSEAVPVDQCEPENSYLQQPKRKEAESMDVDSGNNVSNKPSADCDEEMPQVEEIACPKPKEIPAPTQNVPKQVSIPKAPVNFQVEHNFRRPAADSQTPKPVNNPTPVECGNPKQPSKNQSTLLPSTQKGNDDSFTQGIPSPPMLPPPIPQSTQADGSQFGYYGGFGGRATSPPGAGGAFFDDMFNASSTPQTQNKGQGFSFF